MPVTTRWIRKELHDLINDTKSLRERALLHAAYMLIHAAESRDRLREHSILQAKAAIDGD